MKEKIDIDQWKRKEHFEFFKTFSEPFWGITSEVDCTQAVLLSKKEKHSFFLKHLHTILMAINQLEAFCLRIENHEVYKHTPIHASATILRPNETFGFTFIAFEEDFNVFVEKANLQIKKTITGTGLNLSPENQRSDVIHFSSVPWYKFTALSHARPFNVSDSTPKISTGQYFKKGSKYAMNISIHAHHGLVDGIHAGKLLQRIESILNQPAV